MHDNPWQLSLMPYPNWDIETLRSLEAMVVTNLLPSCKSLVAAGQCQ